MYPHERSLVKELANEPFAIIGVNSDADREQLKQTIKDENLTWRSFWDGGSTQGPIATKWNVQAWPTTYLIDHEGVVHARDLDGEELEAEIELLLARADEAAAQPQAGGAAIGDDL